MSLTIKVVPTLDSRAVDTSRFLDLEVYQGKVQGEVLPPQAPPCFLGAWYRKVFSSTDQWLGIEGTITLGEFTPDEARFNLDGKGRYMDNPSIYMGGKSHTESDAGLGLNLSYTSSDVTGELDYSSPKLAWRPFWRYIYKEAEDTAGNVRRREVNSWNISEPRSLCYYYFPGDTIEMAVYSPLKDYLQLRIRVIKPTTIPKYVKLRKQYELPNDAPLDFYSPIFYSKGHGTDDAEFKRVNSIDQFGNEGYHAKDTKATVSEAVWHEVYLYRKIDGKLMKVPFDQARQTSMICPNEKAIDVKTLEKEKGSEAITIHPEKVRG